MADDLKKDVVIVGRGPVAMSIAAILSQNDIDVVIIDHIEKYTAHTFATRLIALSLSSIALLQKYSLINELSDIAQPISKIIVSQVKKASSLTFDPVQINQKFFGYMIDEEDLWNKLYAKAIHAYKTPMVSASIDEIEIDEKNAYLTLSSGLRIRSHVLIVADGKNSTIRKKLGFNVRNISYRQLALVCDIEHENHHEGTAHEFFMKNGPFATLPKKGGFCSSIVWTESIELKGFFQSINTELLEDLIQSRCRPTLGKIKVASKHSIFPLSLTYSENGTYTRTALIGDAWHSIHPLAGQGLNLGLRDVALLSDMIIAKKRLGLDIGDKTLLDTYNKKRKADILLLIEGMNFINNLYSSNLPFLESLGHVMINAAEKIDPLKKALMSYASKGALY